MGEKKEEVFCVIAQQMKMKAQKNQNRHKRVRQKETVTLAVESGWKEKPGGRELGSG